MAKTVTLALTLLEAKGLSACANEGAAGLLTDPEAAKAYIGNGHATYAAERAINKLDMAIVRAAKGD